MTEPASTPTRTFAGLISPGYTLLLVTGVMLPVSGAVTRYVHFAIVDRLADPASLAVTLPIGELAAAGLLSVVFAVTLFAAAHAAYALVFRGESPLRLRILAIVTTILGLAAATLFLLAGATLLALVGVTTTALIFAVVTLRLGHPLRGRRVVTTLVAYYVITAAYWGVTSGGYPRGDFTFVEESPVPAGAYVRLAASESFIYLGSCSGGSVVQVPSSAVAQVVYGPRRERPLTIDLLLRWSVAIPPPFGTC